MNLFQESQDPIVLDLLDAEVIYYPAIFDIETAEQLFQHLHTNTPWQHDVIKVFGKTYQQPRLTALYADNTNSYSYSGITMHPHPFNPPLEKIKKRVTEITKQPFTTCLINLYRDGNDSNGWHADNEKELGPDPIIASVSFGASRWFHLKHRHDKLQKTKILLEPGSLLLMKGTTQQFWLHQIPKTKKPTSARINLTFRTII